MFTIWIMCLLTLIILVYFDFWKNWLQKSLDFSQSYSLKLTIGHLKLKLKYFWPSKYKYKFCLRKYKFLQSCISVTTDVWQSDGMFYEIVLARRQVVGSCVSIAVWCAKLCVRDAEFRKVVLARHLVLRRWFSATL